ncbi:type 2 isopentenyl-diphosphate Delta-isomerase [Sporolactobacillus shoreicorticis]|uniref:Isopentenyl-diphosphate delta-isomerase n=1 Tax=Sporolactobacillus shoreicorticis TaxID=1923877 RepID=A0ABW5RZ24_9BACL|nr:type 2 isopentenyl-diphosphate Delta-isomerase [Sporolactobacillus shoreicorticis]MCO7125175.1 type 2 isopentenyl-diphosphate Delta-isomerase [Sporolactobacillus shoreicorticis]
MESRKDQHVRLFQETYQQHTNDFDSVKFIHDSLPEMSLKQVDHTTELPIGSWPVPFFINGMTGGSEKTKRINECLSQAAAATGIAVASGSQKAALRDSELLDTFQVLRRVNANGFIFANVGAELAVEQAKRAIDMLEANALQVHLNAPQEIVMPEGDRDFSSWLKNLERIVRSVDVPVVVKEVGFGMSRATFQKLIAAGVAAIDVAGNGGVNFITIENRRRERARFDYLQDWGQSTVISLLEAQPYIGQGTFFASGGVRHPLDVLKALALGARAVGISGTFLHTALEEGTDGLIAQIEEWKEQLSQIMLLLGCPNLQALRGKDLILNGAPLEWARLRGLRPEELAVRSSKLGR